MATDGLLLLPVFSPPIRVLSRVFRGKFAATLKHLSLQAKLQFHGSVQKLARPERFRQFLRRFLIHVLPKGLVRNLSANRDEPHCCCVAARCSALREVLVGVGIKTISNYFDRFAFYRVPFR
jgi:hypothetical protein